MVSVLALYSDDPSSNSAESNDFSIKLDLKRTKRARVVQIFFKKEKIFYLLTGIFNVWPGWELQISDLEKEPLDH